MTDSVVVTGVGVLAAAARGPEALWQVVCGERDGLTPASFPGAGATALAGRAPAVERRDAVRTPVGRRIDRLSLMLLVAARDAIADAALEADAVAGAGTGVVLGSAFGNFEETAGFLDRLGARGTANPLVFPNLVMNASLSYLSIELGVTGPTLMLTQQEVSGEAALAAGMDLVASGAVERCLAGAGDELTPELYAVLREVGALAPGRPRVYDAEAAGCVPGEGAAVLVLERAAVAAARGARCWARLADAVEFSVPAPLHGWPSQAGPLAARLRPALAGASLVIGGAAGLPALDRVEAAALGAAVPAAVPVVAPRAAIGHFGSAGIVGAVVAALAIRKRVVPPGPACDAPRERALRLERRPRPVEAIRRAAVVGIARGGACGVLSFEDVATP
jgi:3-oxoacyl-(acyl-carrier-protein) synthase